jgi:putative FmdB family regulatory protein
MPIYEYECRDCGHVFDALQKMSDQPLTECPVCSQPGLRKLLSAPNFRLKGGGWYETDFKNKNKRNLVDGDKPAKSAGDSDSAGKSPADKSVDKSAEKSTDKSADTGKPATGKSESAGGNAAKAD